MKQQNKYKNTVDLYAQRIYYYIMKQLKRLMTYPEPMFNRLMELSEKTGIAVTEIVRRAIDDYFTKLDQK